MIRLKRRLGRFPAGTVTDYFDAAAEAAFLLDGTGEAVDAKPEAHAKPARAAEKPARRAAKQSKGAAGEDAPDYRHMKKDDLLRLAMARGLDISPRAKVAELIDALERSDDA